MKFGCIIVDDDDEVEPSFVKEVNGECEELTCINAGGISPSSSEVVVLGCARVTRSREP